MRATSLITTIAIATEIVAFCGVPLPASAQVPPGAAEAAHYTGLHAAAWQGDSARLAQLIRSGAPLNPRDGHGRTPLQVATFARQREASACWPRPARTWARWRTTATTR